MAETRETRDVHRPGDVLHDGRYAIVGKLGQGGQATTFEAVDKLGGRHVTVKRFEVKGAASWKEVELAEREAKVLSHLSHPNLPVYVDHFEEGGSLYLVTEHIAGETVASLRAEGALGEREVLRFLADASSALDYLHGRTPPIVHRDIKPSNVIRRPDGSFAVIDFGAVRDRLKITGSTVVGTFGYMAPEQFQGRAMPASDVYAVGTTAVAMLTGKEPEDLPHKGLGIDVEAALGPRARPALVRALAAMVEPDPDVRAARIAPLLAGLRAEGPASAGPSRRRQPLPDDPGDAVRVAAEHAVAAAEANVKRVVEELGASVGRALVDAALGKGSRRDAKRAVGEAMRETRREVKHAARQARREAKRERRRAAAMAVRPPDARPLGGPVLLVVLIALGVAQLAVLLALKVVVPAVLYLLSALFLGSTPGRGLRGAARLVGEAGSRAAGAIGRARDTVRGRAPAVVATEDVDPHAATVIDTTERPARARVRVTSSARAGGGDDTRAEEEALAEEEADSDPLRRRGRGR
jgi:hypothetical protein